MLNYTCQIIKALPFSGTWLRGSPHHPVCHPVLICILFTCGLHCIWARQIRTKGKKATVEEHLTNRSKTLVLIAYKMKCLVC